jgi:hypothetical protein
MSSPDHATVFIVDDDARMRAAIQHGPIRGLVKTG